MVSDGISKSLSASSPSHADGDQDVAPCKKGSILKTDIKYT